MLNFKQALGFNLLFITSYLSIICDWRRWGIEGVDGVDLASAHTRQGGSLPRVQFTSHPHQTINRDTLLYLLRVKHEKASIALKKTTEITH
ncbi:MAG: hypothetical protein DA408_06805 [Bacteroidetes bacterium]|nr:MAG: hypothetical protein C7N36_16000 [Bacteroidota bacterium]PTM13414.1 MAG: hypothetical protein DA408_06805 [Bacteroidota bacterium]